jgi:hypothetical protein
MRLVRKHLTTILIAILVSALTAAAPAIAHGVEHALFAHDSDKVDGKHAVGAGATKSQRKGKLVATNGSGRLPNDIIAKAPNADRLDGIDSKKFVRGAGTKVISRRVAVATNTTSTILGIPGLGRLRGQCTGDGANAIVDYENTTSGPVDAWTDFGVTTDLAGETELVGPPHQRVAWFDTSGAVDGGRLVLGKGTAAGSRRTATLDITPIIPTPPAGSCIFQVQGTIWVG